MASSTKFVWQGWKLIAELDAGTGETGSAFSKAYQWGPDFSNDAGAAGGAGGLLSVRQGGASFFPTYDPMGNITGYLDASGNAAATWDYDAFGRIVAQSGSADAFAYGYATQYTDRESGLVYYGLRYYNPRHGRFVNRDPIEEAGGLNLYGFVGNSPGNRWDVLGLWRVVCETTTSYDKTAGPASCRTEPTEEDNVVMMEPYVVWGDPDAPPPAEYLNEQEIRRQMIAEVASAQQANQIPMYLNLDLGRVISVVASMSRSANAQNNPGKQAPLEWLKRLCATKEGRDQVEGLTNGELEVYDSPDAFGLPSTRNSGGFSSFVDGRDVIFINSAPTVPTMVNLQTTMGYSGDRADYDVGTLRHEIWERDLDFGNPGLPQYAREAWARYATDRFLADSNLPTFFPGKTYSDHLQRTSGATPLGKYNALPPPQNEKADAFLRRVMASGQLMTGWDCSRVGK